MLDQDPVMSAEVTALPQAGMITLRGDFADPQFAEALQNCGLDLPEQRQIRACGAGQVAWMSPDELLVLCDATQVAECLSGLQQALRDQHHLAVDVSGTRVRFAVEGAGARLALAKLCPVDLAETAFGPGDFRRTRVAQVAAAFWMTTPTRFELVCFRSVGDYMGSLLQNAARNLEDVELP